MIDSKIKDETLPKMLERWATTRPDLPAQYSKNKEGKFEPVLFSQMETIAKNVSGALFSLGLKRGTPVGLISDNRKEWEHLSMGILGLGCPDVPRGCDAAPNELAYILASTECWITIVENTSVLKKILSVKEKLPLLKTVVIIEDIKDEDRDLAKTNNITLYSYSEVVAFGADFRAKNSGVVETEWAKGSKDELATLIFTSGTTGEPKGVMLTHENFLTQLDELNERIVLYPGDKALCVLPVWHSFQRLCEYVILNALSSLCYSKPLGPILLADFKAVNPQLIPSVPRIWESLYDGIFRLMRKEGGIVYAMFSFFVKIALIQSYFARKITGNYPQIKKRNLFLDVIISIFPLILFTPLKGLGNLLVYKKIKEKLGKNFRLGVSGGGAFPQYIDEFFAAVGITVVEGYGLTETAPVVAVRDYNDPHFGTIGTAIRGCEIKIVDDTGVELPAGQKGTLLVRGKQVMKGYYKKPELTKKVLSDDGWLDTGDLGIKTVAGDFIIRGRKKDTIVLRGGENIEPFPLEAAISESRYVAQVVIVGQDQRNLGALVLPVKDEILSYAASVGITEKDYSKVLKMPQIYKLIDTEISDRINPRNGFKSFERVGKFAFLEKPFEVGDELSAKQEIMRYKIQEKYEDLIKTLF